MAQAPHHLPVSVVYTDRVVTGTPPMNRSLIVVKNPTEDINYMKNYRIKKVVDLDDIFCLGRTIYFVQRKFLWFWWVNMYQPSYNPRYPNDGRGFYGLGFFLTLKEAKEEILRDLEFNESRERLSKTKPEYIYNLT